MNASLLERLAEVADPTADPSGSSGSSLTMRLRRAWPRGTDRMSLEYVRPDGSTVTGQWFAEADRARTVAAATPGARWAEPGVVLQPDGADRRLRGLVDLASEPGARLVVHRPERRAVVRRASGVFTKVVRPERAEGLLRADLRARATGAIPMPELLESDLAAGRLTWAEAPGRSLHDMIGDESVALAALGDAGRMAGTALRRLHRARPPKGLAHHTIDDERETAARWLRAAARHAWVPPGSVEQLELAQRMLEAGSSEPVVVHRDLHDKQLLIDREDLTVLDVDTLALAEPALDLANLLVHLELRVAQGVSGARAEAVGSTFLDAYRPSDRTMDRVVAYAHATRARLAGVYAFRPVQARAAELIVDPQWSSLSELTGSSEGNRRVRVPA